MSSEGQVALELLLDERLVVGEVEAAVTRVGVRDRLALGQLGGEAENSMPGLGVVESLAVGGVQLRGQVRVEALDGRLLVVTGQRPVDEVVWGGCVDLPADPVRQQLGGRVVVD